MHTHYLCLQFPSPKALYSPFPSPSSTTQIRNYITDLPPLLPPHGNTRSCQFSSLCRNPTPLSSFSKYAHPALSFPIPLSHICTVVSLFFPFLISQTLYNTIYNPARPTWPTHTHHPIHSLPYTLIRDYLLPFPDGHTLAMPPISISKTLYSPFSSPTSTTQAHNDTIHVLLWLPIMEAQHPVNSLPYTQIHPIFSLLLICTPGPILSHAFAPHLHCLLPFRPLLHHHKYSITLFMTLDGFWDLQTHILPLILIPIRKFWTISSLFQMHTQSILLIPVSKAIMLSFFFLFLNQINTELPDSRASLLPIIETQHPVNSLP